MAKEAQKHIERQMRHESGLETSVTHKPVDCTVEHCPERGTESLLLKIFTRHGAINVRVALCMPHYVWMQPPLKSGEFSMEFEQ